MTREEQFKSLKENTVEQLVDKINKEKLDINNALQIAFIRGAKTITAQSLAIIN